MLQTDSSANDIVRKHHALTVSRVDRRNSAFADALRPAPKFAVGSWAWVHNSASTIRQGVKANTDAKVLKVKLGLNWTGPYKVLAVGPCSPADTPDDSPLLFSSLGPSSTPGVAGMSYDEFHAKTRETHHMTSPQPPVWN